MVVHGPLIATLLMDLCRQKKPNSTLANFSYRAISPLFDIEAFSVNGVPTEDQKSASLWAASNSGVLAMQAEAIFKE